MLRISKIGKIQRAAANAAFFVLFVCNLGPSFAEECQKGGMSTSFGEVVGIGKRLKSGPASGKTFTYPPNVTTAGLGRYYAFRIVPVKNGTGPWSLVLRDAAYTPIETLGPTDFADVSSAGLWTARLYTSQVTFDLYVNGTSTDVELMVEDALVMPEKVSKQAARYSWQGLTAAYKSLYQTDFTEDDQTKIRRLGDRIGFFMGLERRDSPVAATPGPGVQQSGTTVSWCCSGVMLTSSLFLTNWHCGAPPNAQSRVWRKGQLAGNTCDLSMVDLSWDDDSVSLDSRCEVMTHNKRLDYAILQLKPVGRPGRKAFEGRPLEIASAPITDPTPGDPKGLRIIHHAECKRKVLSHACTVKNASYKNWTEGAADQLTDFSHDCDTEGGSSGAPVFDEMGRLVGLHHLGFTKQADASCDKENKAVHIHEILNDLKNATGEDADLKHGLYQQIRDAAVFVP